MANRQAPVLVVAGSDSSAGAGLQADLKTVARMGGYATTAVTAITVQDTRFVHNVYPLPADWVAQQMRTCLADMGAGCIKLGMLATQEVVHAVADVLAEWPDIPVVADPVLAGTGGGTLLDEGGRQAYLGRLLPMLSLLTPNLPEAQALAGLEVQSVADMEQAARRLFFLMNPRETGNKAVFVTGGHLRGEQMTDLLFDGTHVRYFHSQRLPGPGFHGTGCVLASAIASGLAQEKGLEEAVQAGLLVLQQAMKESFSLGEGQRLLSLGCLPGGVPASMPFLMDGA